ncbi:hypothetical protein MTR67_035320 [Solanum verrucosum]|uniref:Hexosyltransferase n=1 Tax=Solanum verrucosum TaxID=315347 RepID=A0AAF0U9M0_SOLVR|nr:hypothetical protein MTR67_035320 [Solanum verrucosum]
MLQERNTSRGWRLPSSLEEYLERTEPHQSEMLHLVSHQKSLLNSRRPTEEGTATSPWMFPMQFDLGKQKIYSYTANSLRRSGSLSSTSQAPAGLCLNTLLSALVDGSEGGGGASLKSYAHEDISIGSWMMGLQTTYTDDSRLCCSTTTSQDKVCSLA